MSDVRGVQDQARRDRDKKVKQALEMLGSALTEGSAYSNIDLSGLQQLTQLPAPIHQVAQVITTAFELVQNISNRTQAC